MQRQPSKLLVQLQDQCPIQRIEESVGVFRPSETLWKMVDEGHDAIRERPLCIVSRVDLV